jgi:hypothetical protein
MICYHIRSLGFEDDDTVSFNSFAYESLSIPRLSRRTPVGISQNETMDGWRTKEEPAEPT